MNDVGGIKNEYGFDWPPNYNEESHLQYLKKNDRLAQKHLSAWENLNKNYERSDKLKRMVRHGIPQKFRCEVWMSLTSAKCLMSENKGMYDELVKEGGNKNTYDDVKDTNGENTLDIIKRDLPRTFPENPKFKDPVMLNNLQDVLMAYCLYRPDNGYCQGLNFIAGALLLATQKEDGELLPEECFWLLVAMLDIIPDYHSTKMTSLNNDVLVLNELLKKRIPKTLNHISTFNLPLQMFVTKWFVCIYIDLLPMHTVFRIWDSLFYEGYKIIFRVAVYQFVVHKHDLKNITDISQLAQYFRNLFWDNSAWDDHKYMKCVFKKTGKMKKESLDAKRDKQHLMQ